MFNPNPGARACATLSGWLPHLSYVQLIQLKGGPEIYQHTEVSFFGQFLASKNGLKLGLT